MFQAYREGWDHVIGRLRTLVPPSPFEKVDTVIIRVQDLERARVGYEEKVGLRLPRSGTQTGIFWRCAAPSAYLVAAGRRDQHQPDEKAAGTGTGQYTSGGRDDPRTHVVPDEVGRR